MSETSMTSRLTWTASKYSIHYGQAGGVRLFVVSWKSRQADPNYLMRSDLPGVSQEWKHDDLDVLKDEAEQALAAWLRKVAAGLEPDRDAAFEAWNEHEGFGVDMRDIVHLAYDAGWDARGEPRPARLTDGHFHQNGAHPGWIGHDGHPVHRHQMSTGRTEWEKP
jgi:hypothetical protein